MSICPRVRCVKPRSSVQGATGVATSSKPQRGVKSPGCQPFCGGRTIMQTERCEEGRLVRRTDCMFPPARRLHGADSRSTCYVPSFRCCRARHVPHPADCHLAVVAAMRRLNPSGHEANRRLPYCRPKLRCAIRSSVWRLRHGGLPLERQVRFTGHRPGTCRPLRLV